MGESDAGDWLRRSASTGSSTLDARAPGPRWRWYDCALRPPPPRLLPAAFGSTPTGRRRWGGGGWEGRERTRVGGDQCVALDVLGH